MPLPPLELLPLLEELLVVPGDELDEELDGPLDVALGALEVDAGPRAPTSRQPAALLQTPSWAAQMQ